MSKITLQTYMAELRKYSAPLSIEKHIGLIRVILDETQLAMDRMIKRTSENDMRVIKAHAYQMKVGLATAQYAFGSIEACDLWNACDDLKAYIDSLSESPRVQDALTKMMKSLTDGVEKLVADREAIIEFEKNLNKRIDEGLDPVEFAKEVGLDFDGESEAVRSMLKKMAEYGQSKDLAVGEHETVELGKTADGSKLMATRINLPFETGAIVRSGYVSGRVVAYFTRELIHGIQPESHMLIQVNSALGDYEEFDLKGNKEDLTHPIQQKDAKFCKVLISSAKQIFA